ncbi:hypothetical protein ACYZTX_09720 [Pseudomonas sp. MDT1-17]
MTHIPQFPVSKRDLEKKLISQSARRLVKATGTEMKLSKGRETIAEILGHANCYALKQAVQENNQPGILKGEERAVIHLKLMDNIHRCLNVPLATALELVSQLGFHHYSAMKSQDPHLGEPVLSGVQAELNDHAQVSEQEPPTFSHPENLKISVTFKRRNKLFRTSDG